MPRFSPLLPFAWCAALLVGCTSNDPTTQSAVPAASGHVVTARVAPNFTSRAAGYAIWFPVEPTEKHTSGSSQEWGNYEMFVAQAKTGAAAYAVITMTIPPNVDVSDQSRFMDGVQRGFLKSSGATLVKGQEVTVNGVHARELQTSMGEGEAPGRLYIYCTPKASYQVCSVVPKKDSQKQQAQIDKVLGSFRLLDK